MAEDKDGNRRGYSEGEVEILKQLAEMKVEIETLKEAKFIRREEFDAFVSTYKEAKHVRRDEFEPIQKIVYGMVGLILVAFLTAVIGLVVVRLK